MRGRWAQSGPGEPRAVTSVASRGPPRVPCPGSTPADATFSARTELGRSWQLSFSSIGVFQSPVTQELDTGVCKHRVNNSQARIGQPLMARHLRRLITCSWELLRAQGDCTALEYSEQGRIGCPSPCGPVIRAQPARVSPALRSAQLPCAFRVPRISGDVEGPGLRRPRRRADLESAPRSAEVSVSTLLTLRAYCTSTLGLPGPLA